MKTIDEVLWLSTTLGLAVVIICMNVFPKWTNPYKDGVKDTYKEAFEHGLMVKEITKDDKVIYRWIETHKMNIE